ncbi:biliverdin-producing heme oxygenase [Micromonospora sp. NPDC049679]|uniref:biliverdin-producing heme oxygenase n=1 Tax=Micromonospora sp. NPDC049679 TaxID=3155920 RepID=UPI0033E6FB4A
MSTATASFSTRLRTFTWLDHQAAAADRYGSALVAGELGRDGYADHLAQHYLIYEVLEEAADAMRTDPVAGPFVDDALNRLPALRADLEFLRGPGWARQITPRRATDDYRARLREVCSRTPAWFLAHHYTRYLGDLSHGLLIGEAVTKAYGLTGGDGTAFYRFDAIRDPHGYESVYRERLDVLPLDETTRAGLVGEVGVAHRHTYAVLAELGREPGDDRPASAAAFARSRRLTAR